MKWEHALIPQGYNTDITFTKFQNQTKHLIHVLTKTVTDIVLIHYFTDSKSKN